MLDINKLDITKITRKNAIAYCQFHDDKDTPNLCIVIEDGYYYGYWRCFACGADGWLTNKQMEKLKLKKKKRNKPTSIDWDSLHDNYIAQINETTLIQLSEYWNVNIESIFNIGYDGEAWCIPMYNATHDMVGIQRQFPSGKKCCVDGSQLGMFLNWRKGHPVCVTEGASDTWAIADLGFDAIGKPCATYGKELIRDYINNNDIKQVVLIPDSDKAGWKSALDLHSELLINTNASVAIFKFNLAKDIRDYIKKFGKHLVKHELEECINGF